MLDNPKICSLCNLWLDQELTDSQRMVFESHWEDCDQCRQKIQRWQNLEQEVVAALRLFGSSSSLTDLAEEAFLEQVQTRAVSLPLKDIPSSAKFQQQQSRSSIRLFRLWAFATTLLFSAAITWLVWGRLGTHHQQADSIQIPESSSSAIHQASSASTSLKPVVKVHVQEPAIASTPVTTSRFTVVNVYPVFALDPTDQVN